VVGDKRGTAALCRGSAMRRTVSRHGQRLNGGKSGQWSSVHDGSAWREDLEAATSKRSNGFGQGTSDRPGRVALIPVHVDGRRPRGLSHGMVARWKNGTDRQA
jgi:hypothetical protein